MQSIAIVRDVLLMVRIEHGMRGPINRRLYDVAASARQRTKRSKYFACCALAEGLMMGFMLFECCDKDRPLAFEVVAG